MADGYIPLNNLCLLTVAITLLMFVLRCYWLQTPATLLQKRWERIVPHLNDTLLPIAGGLLVMMTHFYPFSVQGNWLTEKPFGVIICLVLSFIALGGRPRAQKVRWRAFIVALVALLAVIRLATTKMPLLGFVSCR
ncbi:SirB2 family protein [Erwinia pyrifoliae]|uniref:SirB2 family protein n=1 Tax=Erwinia pyrifoliae TaxID=79967 RepID=A0ABY5XD34_ERWPY|nr:SirB2 family protein [Erwinia pyrifoliae]AUX72559.1 siroheme synthase [Erwinia pyrifoliae]MCA8877185.1 siroheme synthase [Erwinia pyrifoliae]MCT2387367.1 SirB2 family protein [Erwinia pyrifoliae]MCU8587033.1 SirB2 family protein [Erwinia pyrifoliae]UWS30900.1 SirB2 family protein [Erwinia pyrifoliae]